MTQSNEVETGKTHMSYAVNPGSAKQLPGFPFLLAVGERPGSGALQTRGLNAPGPAVSRYDPSY